MNFTQTAFFVLLAFALASVAITTRTEIRKLIILGCSFVFYGWWDWRFLGLVLVSTTIDFLAGLLIESARRNDDESTAKLGLGVAVGANLLILGVFKYFDFFSLSITAASIRSASRSTRCSSTSCCRSAYPSTLSTQSVTPSTSIAGTCPHREAISTI
jgi:D-alanyl-lipoteichoic acid acyltransferase DltB (MBOAT superfamily)